MYHLFRTTKKTKKIAEENRFVDTDLYLYQLINQKYTISELIDDPREVLIAVYLKLKTETKESEIMENEYELYWNEHLLNLIFTDPRFCSKKVFFQ